MDKPYIEDAKVVLKHHGEIDQPRDREMLPGPPAKPVFADDSGNEVDDEVDDEDGRALSRAL